MNIKHKNSINPFIFVASGRLFLWGSNANYQLGTSNDNSEEPSVHLKPLEIFLDSMVQQFCCGPESTLVLTENETLYLCGRLNEFIFPEFTVLQKNLSPTEQIIFMHISKSSEIFIVTNAGSIYKSIESIRSKSLIFQRFYDYDSEENGPIWKLLKGYSYYAVLTKANKFYTTFSESGHHLKTFREISKFKNLRMLDMAVGEEHILIHGIPRSSTLSATVGGPVGTHKFASRSFILMPQNAQDIEDYNAENDISEKRQETPKPNTPIHQEIIKDNENANNDPNEAAAAAAVNGNTDTNQIEEAKKSPSASIKSKKSARSLRFDGNVADNNESNGKLLRPHTPYPDSKNGTPLAIKRTPLRNQSYEAAMNDDYLEHTSPALIESLENIPEHVVAEVKSI